MFTRRAIFAMRELVDLFDNKVIEQVYCSRFVQ